MNSKIKKHIISMFLLMPIYSKALVELPEEDFSKNSVSVVSVSEGFVQKIKSEGEQNQDKMESFLSEKCSQELNIFCPDKTKSNYNCLRDNFNLTTGTCRAILEKEMGKGISFNRLSIHDLKLTSNSKYLGKKDTIGYVVADYLSNEMFDYRGIRFRKGFIKARNYKYDDYKGQYVLFSAKPLSPFKDKSGLSFDPRLQKGPFFFDEKGNVKIGTLSNDYEYKKNIIMKKGTLIVFDDNHNFIQGTLSKSVRIGKCGFLSGMKITSKEIKRCSK